MHRKTKKEKNWLLINTIREVLPNPGTSNRDPPIFLRLFFPNYPSCDVLFFCYAISCSCSPFSVCSITRSLPLFLVNLFPLYFESVVLCLCALKRTLGTLGRLFRVLVNCSASAFP